MANILIVDDDASVSGALRQVFEYDSHHVAVAPNGAAGLERLASDNPDVVFLDVKMPGMDGLEALDEITQLDEAPPVIMITAFGTSRNTREAFKRGAFDFIEKPFKNDDVLLVVRNAVAQQRLLSENRVLRQNLRAQANRFSDIIGHSPRIRSVFEIIAQAAPSRATILVSGESGTGKELVARAVHANSPRAGRPFVTVNSGSLPPDLLESNLFGHVKGAFTGAVGAKKGLFEMADNGSIFFDEIGTVPLETQAKLLRVLQEREFRRLGGVDTIKVDVRIIAATNVDLRQMVEDGSFREDLYYRLHVIAIELPPLRERLEDVPLLARSFLTKYGKENNKPDLELTPDAMQLLEAYHWPGNVRELENVIERAAVLTVKRQIGPELVPDVVRASPSFQLPHFDMPSDGIPFRKIIDDMEVRLIARALEAAGGVQKRAAELLRVKPTTLNEMIKRHGIRTRGSRAGAAASARARAGATVRTARGPAGAQSAPFVSDLVEAFDKRLSRVD
jgi:two-component system response regulator PilR (NtrC family)